MDAFNEFAKKHGAYEEPEFRLFRYDTDPVQWFMSVNGEEKHPITVGDLSSENSFTRWLLGRNQSIANVPNNKPLFKQFIERLRLASEKLEEEPLPFMQTDAGIKEKLAHFFGNNIPLLVRKWGNAALEGGGGQFDEVRIKNNKVFFKWEGLVRYLELAWRVRGKELDAVKQFITDHGGHNRESGRGVRRWFKWKYWLPLDVFDEDKLARWLKPEEYEKEDVEGE